MLTAETIKTLKQTNVSVDGDLTKQRVKDLLQSASKEQKSAIEDLAGLKRSSINRVYATGNISAKIALAVAQSLNVSPFYLTGEVEETGECDQEALKSFLSTKGYGDLQKQVKNPRRKAAKPTMAKEATDVQPEEKAGEQSPPEPAEEAPPIKAVLPAVETPPQSDVAVSAALVSEEETVQMIHTLFIRAKYSESAKETLTQIISKLL